MKLKITKKQTFRNGTMILFLSASMFFVTQQSFGCQSAGQGTHDGYFWSLWMNGGSSCFTLGSGGNYSMCKLYLR